MSRAAEALADILQLHTDTRPGGQSGLRSRCRECGFAYPCPTVVIAKGALNAYL